MAFPYGALGAIAFVVVRVIVRRRRGLPRKPSVPARLVITRLLGMLVTGPLPSAALLARVVGTPLLLIYFLAIAIGNGGSPPRWLVWTLLACGIALAPLAVTLLAVPLGWPRVAWLLTRVGGFSTNRAERTSSGALAAARALLRRSHETGARFVDRRLAECPELGTNGATAAAIVAMLRGDRDQAVAILRLVDAMSSEDVSHRAQDVAREQLALDALRRGIWRRLIALSKRPAPPRLVVLLGAVARRVTQDADAPSAASLWWGWLLAPRLARTRLVVSAALAAPPPAPAFLVAPSLDAHAALIAREPSMVRAEDVDAAVRSLDLLRASAPWRAGVARRALALGLTSDPEATCESAMREAEADIAAAVVNGAWPAAWVPVGATGNAIRGIVREERLRSAEGLVGELGRRARDRRDLAEIDEWRAWADARRACDELRADGVGADVLFSMVFAPLTAYGVRLTNVRAFRSPARDLFRYLRDLAEQAHAVHALDLAQRNVLAVRGDRLPLEAPLLGEAISDPGRLVVMRMFLFLAALFALAMVAIFSLSWLLGYPADARGPLLTFAAALIGLRSPGRRLVDCAHSIEGLSVQTIAGRAVVLGEDIRYVVAGPGPLVRIGLRRAPWWLARSVFTVAASREQARAHVERVKRLLNS